MKKLLISMLTVAVLFLPASSLFASGETTFLKGLSNLADMQDNKTVQSIYGVIEFEEDEDHISADYRVSISTTTDAGSRTDSFSRVSAFIKFTNHNEINDATPFREMTVQANGEITTRGQDDVYFKLNNFNIGLKEPLPFAVVDVENVMANVDMYRGIWYHSFANELAMSGLNEEMFDTEEYLALEKQLKEEPKEAILGIAEKALQNTEVSASEEEISQFINALELLLDSKLFTERDVVSGRNTGFKFFNLNKGAILDLMSEIAAALDEEFSYEDQLTLRSALGKISLSGIYRIEDVYDVIDNLLVRFKLREAGPVQNLEFNYRFKLWDIGKENSVKAPAEFEEWEDIFGSYEDETYFDESWFEDDYYYDESGETEPEF